MSRTATPGRNAAAEFNAWITTAKACTAPAIATFASGLDGDHGRPGGGAERRQEVGTEVGPRRYRALALGEGPLLYHIGLYAWRRYALERFVALPPSRLELRKRMEQMRALEAGMRIDAALVDTVPLGVDTLEDLARARVMLAEPSSGTYCA